MFGSYEVVIGLEIHAQLKTQSKLFSAASTKFGCGDNENVTAVCLGMPGTLPVLNEDVLALAVKTGLGLNCRINDGSTFARKQYFYPDLSKGYQISQFDRPICGEGFVDFFVEGEKKRVRLERAHLEEDAGKSTHFGNYSLINFNRAGVPLLEIVSAPDMRSPKEAAAYAKAVRQILLYVESCDGNLEEGSLRCDCNVSVRKIDDPQLGIRVEIKNINSFRFIEKAIEYEARRQIDCLEHGETLVQETRLYDSVKNKTISMRTKEEADDYRYFRDPDILPVFFDEGFVEAIDRDLEEMPSKKIERFQNHFGLSLEDSEQLCVEKSVANYFEAVTAVSGSAKITANWVLGDLMARCNEDKVPFERNPVAAGDMGALIKFLATDTLSGKMGKVVLDRMWVSGENPQKIIDDLGLKQITDPGEIRKVVEAMLLANPEKVSEYKGGKEKLYGFFVGQLMKATKGQAHPETLNKVLREELAK